MFEIAAGIYLPLIGLVVHLLLQPFIFIGDACRELDDKMTRWMTN